MRWIEKTIGEGRLNGCKNRFFVGSAKAHL
jgi:hypothetical protein